MGKTMKAMQQTAWTGCKAPAKEHLQAFIGQTSAKKYRSITEISSGREMRHNIPSALFSYRFCSYIRNAAGAKRKKSWQSDEKTCTFR